jgi:hypothetical protein
MSKFTPSDGVSRAQKLMSPPRERVPRATVGSVARNKPPL